jgi:LacI family transcriptional regulator
VTIREVARAAGVSTQTVSRVLNQRPDVAPETFDRVQQVIADTGYSPNMLARGLTQGRTHVLGVVVYGLEYFGPSRILTGIEQQAAEMGYSMTLTLIHRPETRDVDGILTRLEGHQVDGVIWAIPEVANNRDWLRSRIHHMAVPLVLVGGTPSDEALPSISIDNVTMGRLATSHLLAGGARHVGIVTGPLDWWEAQQRHLGWRETLLAAAAEPSDRLVVEGDWTASSGEEGLHELLRRSPDVDAVFASNDQMALGVLHAAHRLGLRVPDDLSVAGVDDIAEGPHFWPPLTTVRQPLRAAGALAVETIDRAIRSARPGRRTEEPPATAVRLLQPQLIVRQSSRPTPSG